MTRNRKDIELNTYYMDRPSVILEDWDRYVEQFTGAYKAKLESNEKNFWHYVADHRTRAIQAGKYKEEVTHE